MPFLSVWLQIYELKKNTIYILIYIYICINKSWEVYVGETVIKNSDCVKLQCIKKNTIYILIYIYICINKSWEVYVGETVIKNSDCVKLQCIKIDSKLHFWWSCLRSM